MVHIKNIKISLSLPKELSSQTQAAARVLAGASEGKRTSSFFILRTPPWPTCGGWVYTVFFKGTHINVTKLKSEEEILPACQWICNQLLLVFNSVTVKVKIDNMTASGDLGKELMSSVSLRKLCLLLNEDEDLGERTGVTFARYNSQKFPGCFIKFSHLGTAILFKTGKFVIVGVSKERDAVVMEERLKEMLLLLLRRQLAARTDQRPFSSTATCTSARIAECSCRVMQRGMQSGPPSSGRSAPPLSPPGTGMPAAAAAAEARQCPIFPCCRQCAICCT